MAKLTLRDRIAIALTNRGEERIEHHASTGRAIVFTRKYIGLRGSEGRLVPAPSEGKFWLVSKSNGDALRVGRSWSNSRPASDDVKRQLLLECPDE